MVTITCKEGGLSPSPPSSPSADDKCSGGSSSGNGSTEHGSSSSSEKSAGVDGRAVSADGVHSRSDSGAISANEEGGRNGIEPPENTRHFLAGSRERKSLEAHSVHNFDP